MTQDDIIIFGAGCAGLAAAAELAAQGQRVTILEQRTTAGGAVHRQPTAGAPKLASTRHDRRRWERLSAVLRHPNVTIRHQVVFTALDGDGVLVAEDRAERRSLHLRPKAVIFALGALEKVRPLPGWDLAGVSTAGGLQVLMKETGTAPKGEVILAGSGPLLVVMAAQMVQLGNAPKAVIEWGNPLGFGTGLRLLARQPAVALSGLGPLLRVLTSSTRYLRGAELLSIQRQDGRLKADLRHGKDRLELTADCIGLHHGIRPNSYGMPPEVTMPRPGHPAILHAGDCDIALGADAAVTSGQDKARRLLALLAGRPDPLQGPAMARHIRSQARLWQSFAPSQPCTPLKDLPDETLLCRCERRSIGDLKALIAREDMLGLREIKHNGRFGMGACQGRFCAHNTASLLNEIRNSDASTPSPQELTGARWPARPVSIASLLEAPLTSGD